jgi:hypothetical protein
MLSVRVTRFVVGSAVLAGSLACDPQGEPVQPVDTPPDAVRITPTSNIVTVDEFADFTCSQTAAGALVVDFRPMDWSASPPAIATASPSAGFDAENPTRRVRTTSPGTAEITCAVQNSTLAAFASQTVRPYTLTIIPASPVIVGAGQSTQIAATLTTHLGRVGTLGARTIVWEALTPGVIGIATTTSSIANVTGLAMGSTTLRATVVDAAFPGVSFGTNTVTVTVPALTCGAVPTNANFVISELSDPGGFAVAANMPNQAPLTIAAGAQAGTVSVSDPTGRVNVVGPAPTPANGCTLDLTNLITLGGMQVRVTLAGTYLSSGDLVWTYTVQTPAGVTLTTYQFLRPT